MRLPAAILALVLAPAAAALAQPRGLTFAMLSGAWSGTGSVTLSSGNVERIRCRASYEVVPSGNAFQQKLRCTSDSYDFNLQASVVRTGADAVSGTWTEVTRNANGSISGRISGSSINANIQGPAFSASFSMTIQADRQTVRIRSQGAELSSISITLRRGAG
jgi:hypothetical protein